MEEQIRRELLADLGNGDITTELALDEPGRIVRADIVLRESGVICGIEVASKVFQLLDSSIVCTIHHVDGEELEEGVIVMQLEGPASAILSGERVALNFMQRMCGIATLTRNWTSLAKPFGIRIVGTRKTTPGFRLFEKHAIRVGGGFNHRMDLDHAVMLKDNHFAASGHDNWQSLVESVKSRISHTMKIIAEADSIEMLEPLIAGGADVILLDNFSAGEVHQAIGMIAGRAIIEISGGVNSGNLGDYLITGVDVISTGALSHSYSSLDLGMDFREDG